MSRQGNKGPVHGPYVTFRLISRVNTPISQTGAVVDVVPMPANFRVCHVSWAALGITANATAAITNNAGSSGTGYFDIDATTYGTRKLSDFATTSSGFRSVPKGDSLRLLVTTDGAGVVPAGALCAWVTGYFTDPITKASKYAESGQSRRGGPVYGYYDWITLTNLRQNANSGEQTECDFIAPYACRVMAVTYHVVGQTETTGTITTYITKNASSIHTAVDVDAMGADATNGDTEHIDATTTPAFVGARRDLARGDRLSLYVGTGAADVVPIGALTAHVLVWVQGHIDYTSAYADGVDHPTGVTGPALGGIVAVPMINKRLAQAAIRTEDRVLLPCDLRTMAVIQARQTSQVTARRLSIGTTTQITGDHSTQNYILHNEGTNFPAPGSWTGNTVTNGGVAGEDNAARSQTYGNTLDLRLTGVGSAVFNDTCHALSVVRSHVQGWPVSGVAYPDIALLD